MDEAIQEGKAKPIHLGNQVLMQVLACDANDVIT
jgi:hypothetical protein